jgi:hypothetical protein
VVLFSSGGDDSVGESMPVGSVHDLAVRVNPLASGLIAGAVALREPCHAVLVC